MRFAKSYDASSDGTYSASPINTTFKGDLEGLGNTISYLSIDFQGGDDVGLFRSIGPKGRVKNVRLTSVKIVGTADGSTYAGTGLLAGSNYGSVDNSFASGSIQLPGGDNELPAGLIGGNF
jgi:hypothetical protein